MHQPLPRPAGVSGVPWVIKRNTALFALSQSFMGAGTQLGYGVGPLMVVALTGSASLAGLTVALFGISRFMVSYPVGKVTDTYGRKPGIQLGLVLALIGTLTVGLSMAFHSFAGLTLGMLVFGMGMNAAQQLRVGAADMFPPRLRAQALGFVATGSMLGLAISPFLMWFSEGIAPRVGIEPIALPWLMVPTLILLGMVLVTFVNPDPKEIGMNLQRYYPDYKQPPPLTPEQQSAFSAKELWAHTPSRLAIVSNAAGQGNMAIVMVLTSLVLHHHGHSLTAIAFSHMFHSAGMFAFTIPLGRLADRFGRERVMYPGVGISLLGALCVTFIDGYWWVTLGTFLVGLGWSAAFVASTALIADHARTEHRGRAIGVSESAAGVMSVVAAGVTGPLVECTSLPAAGAVAALIAAVPLAMLAWTLATRRR
ncbi:MAG: MFS transporter [Alphaproteobacteria bacterium]|nr:MFS transporter [Alphaproteobacteria bacterium]